MREEVRQVKNGWLVAIAIFVIAGAYFFLLGTSGFQEPGANIEYNLEAFEDLDKIDALYVEKDPIVPAIDNPRALAAAAGKVYIAGDNAVAVYGDNDQETARFAVPGVPSCLAIADDGTIFVGLQKTVAVLDAAGAVKAQWKDFTERSFLTAIAVHGPDVYVADAGKRVVYHYNRDGALQNKIGEKDPARDVPGLEAPSPYLDLAINPDGDLWVVNPGKLGLEQYRPDGSIVTSWYKPSVQKLEGFPGCCNPTHIAFNSKGDLITSEKGLIRVKTYEVTAGQFDGLVASSKQFPQEQSLRDLVVDSKDRVLLLDGPRKSVRVFTRKEVPHGSANQPQ